jgi:hypothetical protein
MSIIDCIERDDGPSDPLNRLLTVMEPDRSHVLRLCAIPHTFDGPLISAADPAIPGNDVQRHVDAVARLSLAERADAVIGGGSAAYRLVPQVRKRLLREWLLERARDLAEVNGRILLHLRSLVSTDGDDERLNDEIVFHAVGAEPESSLPLLEAACRKHVRVNRPLAARALITSVRELRPLLSAAFLARLDLLDGEALTAAGELGAARRRFEDVLATERGRGGGKLVG